VVRISAAGERATFFRGVITTSGGEGLTRLPQGRFGEAHYGGDVRAGFPTKLGRPGTEGWAWRSAGKEGYQSFLTKLTSTDLISQFDIYRFQRSSVILTASERGATERGITKPASWPYQGQRRGRIVGREGGKTERRSGKAW